MSYLKIKTFTGARTDDIEMFLDICKIATEGKRPEDVPDKLKAHTVLSNLGSPAEGFAAGLPKGVQYSLEKLSEALRLQYEGSDNEAGIFNTVGMRVSSLT